MSSWDRTPDAERIQDLAVALDDDWGNQQVLDEVMLSYMLLTNSVDSNKPTDTMQNGVKGFRGGLGGMVVKEDAALLTVTPGLHINVPTEDVKDREHSSLLESWMAGAWKLSQMNGQVWFRKPTDLRGLGRAWSNVYPHPSLWTSKEYDAIVREWADSADDPERRKAAEKKVQEWKRDRWPIRWRYVRPRGTWPSSFESQVWLPEVVEIRKMRRRDIEAEFGEEKLAGEYQHFSASAEIDVYEWANHDWCATVIAGEKDAPTIARKYEHGLGMSPYVLAEAELLPDNDNGWRWAGALFHAQSMLETFDELMADLRENHRDNTRTPLLMFVDKEDYDEDAKVGGRPEQIKLEPGGKHTFWLGEKVELAPVPQINPQSIALLQEVKQLIFQNMIRPIERGEAKSGTSQNQFVTAVQIAEREFDPSMKALTQAAENVAKLHFRAVLSLNKRFPDRPDKVAVFPQMGSKQKGVIEVGPDDVRGWENAIQARASRAIPIDRNIQVATAQGEMQLGLDPPYVYETTLGIENPEARIRASRRHRLLEATFQAATEETLARAQQKLNAATPADLQRVQELFAGASPDLQAALMQEIPELAAMVQGAPAPTEQAIPQPGDVNQSLANVRRTGTAQEPQLPDEAVMV